MLGDLFDFMDDLTGNVVSDFSSFHEKRERQRQHERMMSHPANQIALKKMRLAERIKECNKEIETYKDLCPSISEMYTEYKKEAMEELELLK